MHPREFEHLFAVWHGLNLAQSIVPSPMEFRDQAAKETSALVARLFTESAETSRQRLAAFRTAINNATKALEAAIGSTPQFERELSELVARLARTATAEADSAAERASAEARVEADALRAELKSETKEREAFATALQDARARLESLQEDLDAEKQRSETARREVTDAHEALKKLEAARVEAVGERDQEARARAAAEAEEQRLRDAADVLQVELGSLSDQLEAAIAERARLEDSLAATIAERVGLEDTLAATQSQAEAAEAKLASVTTLFKQSAARMKTLEKEHETAMRELVEGHSISLRDLEASHRTALLHAVKEAEATSEAALRELELKHMNALRDVETKYSLTLRQVEAEHVSLQHELETRYAAAQRDLEAHSHRYRDLEDQLLASAHAGPDTADNVVSRVDDLLEGFHALAGATTVADVLATLVEHLAAEFSRVALFHVRGNHLEGSNQIGFEFDNDIAKLVFPLGLDSLLTRAVISGRVERVGPDELADSGLAPFGGAPTCALALPVVVQGETVAIVYADDSGRAATELSSRFARALLQHAVAILTRLTNELRLLAELRGYATSLIVELEEMYLADVASGKAGKDLQNRLKNNLDFARSIYATRIQTEGLEAAPLFEEQLASVMETQAKSPFGRDLDAIAGRSAQLDAHRKAEAS